MDGQDIYWNQNGSNFRWHDFDVTGEILGINHSSAVPTYK